MSKNYPDGMRFGGKEPGNPYADEQPEVYEDCAECGESKYEEELIDASFKEKDIRVCAQCFAEICTGFVVNAKSALIGVQMDDEGMVTLKIRTR